jgi:hypothetical protein
MRRLPVVTATAVAAAVAATLVALPSPAASGASAVPPVGPVLWFHSTAGTYAADAAADPGAGPDGRAPDGSFVDTKKPTGSAAATATFAGGVLAGFPNSPTFSMKSGVSGLKAVCYDVFLSSTTPQPLGLTVISSIETPDGESIGLGNLVEPSYTSGVVRVTGVVRPDIDGAKVPPGSTLNVISFIDAGNGLTLNYDATQVASSMALNPKTCAGKPVDYTSTAPPPTTGSGALPTVSRGLQFRAAIPSDPQRGLGEPAVTVDKDGTIYTCGPTGFSKVADFANASTDGGDQFHLLGQPPRGQISTGQGGGDCALASAIEKNGDGNYQLAYAGLGPLDNFSTFTSPDKGRHLTGSIISESIPPVDRQWIAFTDDMTAFFNYNHVINGQTVQKSTDGGLTYGLPVTVASDGGRLGQIRAIADGVVPGVPGAVVYFPYSAGNKVKLAMSLDSGDTWSQCLAVDAGVDPTAGFVAADHDTEGNIYVTYTEKGAGRDTYVVGLAANKVQNCKGTSSDSGENNVDPGFTKKVRVNREGIETTVMPWAAASGDPGRVAVAYYGTEDVGDPDSGEFDATWHVFVSQTLDLFASTPQWDQVQATTHPFHYDSICLGGLGCDVTMGDRSLVDFFSMEYNQGTGALAIVLSNASKKPDDAAGKTSTPTVLIQRSGPSNGGGSVTSSRRVLMTGVPDPTGDATAAYSTNVPQGPVGDNVPGMDLTDVQIGPEVNPETGAAVPNGGFTVRMKVADLSDSALQSALADTTSTSLVFLFRYIDGYQQSSVAAYWDPVTGFRFAHDDYTEFPPEVTTLQTVRTYPGATAIPGAVDQENDVITLSVPRSMLKALTPWKKGVRPKEVAAKPGDRIYEAVAFTLANPLPLQQLQVYLYQTDNAPSFDFLIPGQPPEQQPPPNTKPPGGGGGGDDGGNLATTGGLGAPVLATLLVLTALWVRRRRRASTTLVP